MPPPDSPPSSPALASAAFPASVQQQQQVPLTSPQRAAGGAPPAAPRGSFSSRGASLRRPSLPHALFAPAASSAAGGLPAAAAAAAASAASGPVLLDLFPVLPRLLGVSQAAGGRAYVAMELVGGAELRRCIDAPDAVVLAVAPYPLTHAGPLLGGSVARRRPPTAALRLLQPPAAKAAGGAAAADAAAAAPPPPPPAPPTICLGDFLRWARARNARGARLRDGVTGAEQRRRLRLQRRGAAEGDGGSGDGRDAHVAGWPEPVARGVIRDCALALSQLHGLGVSHRDVKPGTVGGRSSRRRRLPAPPPPTTTTIPPRRRRERHGRRELPRERRPDA